jgi:hypothetical protein
MPLVAAVPSGPNLPPPPPLYQLKKGKLSGEMFILFRTLLRGGCIRGIFLVTYKKELSQTVARILEYLTNNRKGKDKVKGEKKEQRKKDNKEAPFIAS